MDAETKSIYLQAKASFDAKKYDEAEPLLENLAKSGGKFADIYYMLGVISHSKGKFEQAVRYLEQSLEINPNYMEAALNLTVILNDLGHYQRAHEVYQNALKTASKAGQGRLDPLVLSKLANMHAELGDVYRSLGEYGEAIQEYEKAVRLRPMFVDIQTRLGIALRENGEIARSIEQLKVAQGLNPNYPLATLNLAVSLYAAGEYSESAKAAGLILKQDAAHKEALLYKRMAEEAMAKK